MFQGAPPLSVITSSTLTRNVVKHTQRRERSCSGARFASCENSFGLNRVPGNLQKCFFANVTSDMLDTHSPGAELQRVAALRSDGLHHPDESGRRVQH